MFRNAEREESIYDDNGNFERPLCSAELKLHSLSSQLTLPLFFFLLFSFSYKRDVSFTFELLAGGDVADECCGLLHALGVVSDGAEHVVHAARRETPPQLTRVPHQLRRRHHT